MKRRSIEKENATTPLARGSTKKQDIGMYWSGSGSARGMKKKKKKAGWRS